MKHPLEHQNFRVKLNLKTAHDSYEAWREGDHDDLVLSLSLASWWVVKRPIQTPKSHFLWQPHMGRREFHRRFRVD